MLYLIGPNKISLQISFRSDDSYHHQNLDTILV